jgi:hypothetical protein
MGESLERFQKTSSRSRLEIFAGSAAGEGRAGTGRENVIEIKLKTL